MAYTKSPTQDTFSVERIHLSREINARDGGTLGRDEDLLNVFVEPVKNKQVEDKRHFIVKRAGADVVYNAGAFGTVRGMFFWEDQHELLYCVGNDIYLYNVVTTASGAIPNPFGTTSGDVGFCLYQYDTGVSVVVATDGTTLITIDSAFAVVTCVDADLPAHLPYPVYLDGYIFLSKINTADIYNSNLNNPLSWTAGDFIAAEMEGDNLIRIAKLNNYIVAFGSTSIEYFWDAAVATGSPLQRNDTPIKLNSYLGGLSQFGNSLFFIGHNENGQPDIYMLKDFKIEEMGSPTISRYLNAVTTPISTWRGAVLSFKGHTFYAVNAGTGRTYVLDIDTKLWARWGWQGSEYFDIYQSSSPTTLTNSYSYFTIGTSDIIYRFHDTTYTDNGTSITCSVTTEADDFGTLNRKTMRRATIIGDRPTSPTTTLIQWSDDDAQTFNSGLSTTLNQDLPCVYRLGNFRQRSFKITYSANTDFRIQSLEVEINKGRS